MKIPAGISRIWKFRLSREHKRVLFVALLVLTPIVESGILILMARYWGHGLTFALVVLSTMLGFFLESFQYPKFRSSWRMLRNSEDLPKAAIVKASENVTLFLIGVFLFLTPGFITDGLGFISMHPGVRKWYLKKTVSKERN
ncbi:MAG: FxsA family protein [Candidatus Sumerlaeia bacterium]